MSTTPVGNAGTFAQRIEHKYWIPRAELGRVIDVIQEHAPTFHFTPSGWASVRSLYLDTDDLRCYRDYFNGLSVRWKIRIREYGNEGQFGDQCWVEIKMKNRGVGSKRRFSCREGDAARLVHEGADISSCLRSNGDPEILRTYGHIAGLISEHRLRPTVRIQCERMAFQHTATDQLRITLDRDVRCKGAPNRPEGRFQGMILEVKSTGERPQWFYELRNKFTMHRAHRMSKFAWAVGTVMGIYKPKAGAPI